MEKDKQIELWDEIASKFSKVGPEYWNYFGEKLVSLSNIKKNSNVLDIGTGRGSVLFPVSYNVGDFGNVIGIDFSKNMVNMTNDEIKMKKITNLKVLLMDMKELDFEDEYFDNIILGFSLGCILNSDIHMKKMIKLLKKDGELSFTIWGKQKDQIWLSNIVNKYIKPIYNKKESNTIEINLTEYIRNRLENLYLKEIKVYEEEKEIIYLNENQWWEEMNSNAVRNVFKSIEALGQDQFDKFKREVDNALQDFKKENGICFNMNVIYAFVEK